MPWKVLRHVLGRHAPVRGTSARGDELPDGLAQRLEACFGTDDGTTDGGTDGSVAG
jgi:hypothetical protein